MVTCIQNSLYKTPLRNTRHEKYRKQYTGKLFYTILENSHIKKCNLVKTRFPIQQNKNKLYPEDCNLQLSALQIVPIQKQFTKPSSDRGLTKYTGKTSYTLIKP